MEHNRRKKARDLMTRTGYPAGGHLGRDKDESEDKDMIKKAIDQHDDQLHGGKKTRLKLKHGGAAEGEKEAERMDRPKREHHAKGGAAGKKGGTKVNVIVMPSGHGDAPGGLAGGPPPMGAAPPHPPMAPPPGAMPPHPPMAPPGAMGAGGPPPPGMPPRPPGMKSGGRAKRAYGGMSGDPGMAMQAPPMSQQGPGAGGPVMQQPRPMGYKRGGTVEKMTGGAGGGKGRLEKAESLGFKHGRGR